MSFTNPYPASRLTLDATNSLSSGLVGFWPLTDGGSSTIAKDITSNANDGTESGSVSWASTDIGAAASFDGVDDRFEVDDAGDFDFGTGDFSVSAWVYYDTIASGFTQVLTRGDTSLGTACWFGIYKNSSTHKFIFDVDDNISKVSATSSVSATSGAWFHVVGVRNSGGTNAIYINGVSTGTASDNGNSISQTGATNQEFRIGCQRVAGTYQEFHDGYIQNVRIYNRALSATEVATLYNRPWEGTNYGDLWPYSPPAPADATLSTDTAATSLMSGCVHWWPLTDGTGTTPEDISGTDTLAASGSPTWATTSIGEVAELYIDTNIPANANYYTSDVYGNTYSSTNAHSISFWVKAEIVSGPTIGFFQYGDNQTDGSPLYLCQFDTGTIRWYSRGTYHTGKSVVAGEWYYAALTSDGTTVRMYFDGVEVASTSTTSAVGESASNQFWLGAGYRTISGNQQNIWMQNVRIWDRALSADEITLLYERPFEGLTYGDEFHYDPPTPANLTPLDNSSGINTDCVGWWPLTDGSGTAATDISGNSYTGTARLSQGWATTSLGTAADNTSLTNGGFTFGDQADLDMNGNKSFSMWVKPNGGSVVQVLFEKRRSSGGLEGYAFFVEYGYDSKVRFLADSGSSTTTASSASALITDMWSNVSVVVSGNDATVYVNGVAGTTVTSTDFAADLSNTVDFVVGYAQRYPLLSDDFDGNIQNVRVWNRALSAAEVWSIYENPWLGSAYSDAAAVIYNYILRSKRFRRL